MREKRRSDIVTERNQEIPRIFLTSSPWENNSNEIWLATTMQLRRNIQKFNFPHRLDKEKKKLVGDLVLDSLKDSSGFQNFIVLEAASLSPLEKDFFSEHFLIFDSSCEGRREQTFLIEKTGRTGLVINAQDHVEIHGIEVKNELEKRFESILQYEQTIEKQMPYAFSNQFGYLTADPEFSGTGLSVRAYLHIPAICLSKKIKTYLHPEKIDDLVYTTLHGDEEHITGNILVIKNRYSTGVSEEAIISSIRNAAMRISSEENLERQMFLEKNKDAICAEISRAVGNVSYAYMMDTTDAFHTLSLIKLGLELSLLKGVDLQTINELFFSCRRGHIVKIVENGTISHEEIDKKRALYVKQALKSLCMEF